MKKWGRKILFWTLVALFFAVAPTVIMYAKGYRFDFGRGVFVHSGTITIKTNPREIDLSLNGEIEDSTQLDRINNAFNISGLIPKNYELAVSAPGFQAWNKKTDIHSGIASEFWNIVLARNEYERDNYEISGIEKFFISPKSDYIAYTLPSDKGTFVNAVSATDKTVLAEFNFSGWKLVPDERKENIEWSPEEDYLSIPLEKINPENETGKEPVYNYFIADPALKNSFNLNEFIGKDKIKNVRWDPKDKNYLFFLENDSLFKANIRDKNDIVIISETVSGYDLSEEAVYFSKKPNELVYKTRLDGHSEKIQLTSNFPEPISASIEKLIVYDDLRLVFLDANKNLFIYNRGEFETYFKKLSGNIEGMHFSDDGKKLLFWTKNEISVYFLRQWTVQPLRNEDETQNITRYSEELKNVQWFKDYEHIIFSAGPQIKFIEIDPRDKRNCMNLTGASFNSPFVIYNSYLERLFFTDKNGDSSPNLYSIIFPEKIPLLGLL